jgi:hypothetical protein
MGHWACFAVYAFDAANLRPPVMGPHAEHLSASKLAQEIFRLTRHQLSARFSFDNSIDCRSPGALPCARSSSLEQKADQPFG